MWATMSFWQDTLHGRLDGQRQHVAAPCAPPRIVTNLLPCHPARPGCRNTTLLALASALRAADRCGGSASRHTTCRQPAVAGLDLLPGLAAASLQYAHEKTTGKCTVHTAFGTPYSCAAGPWLPATGGMHSAQGRVCWADVLVWLSPSRP